MFGFFKKEKVGQKITFIIEGMHCASCAMNIDGALEDIEGVLNAETNYAKSVTVVTYDPSKVSINTLRQAIESLEYSVRVDLI